MKLKRKRTDSFYARLARNIETFVKEKVRSGAKFVHYREVFEEFGIDRFTCAIALGWLVFLNQKHGEPLWSSLVCRQTDNICGSGFWIAARDRGYEFEEDLNFMYEQRALCIKGV